ncbi:unnamed protein product [Soboliphyme baturini]|uniref:DUF3730 domain-containing protein n=1 Tax=Soboliphyme baturini TaxID=241478 RepID=A0A183INH1_9BILA|nr:unnamed protein product [Soboliphyme baturini]
MSSERVESFLRRLQETQRDAYLRKREVFGDAESPFLTDSVDWHKYVKCLRQKYGDGCYKALCIVKEAFDKCPTKAVSKFLAVDGSMHCLVGLLTTPMTEPRVQLKVAECLVSMTLADSNCCLLLCKAFSPYLGVLMSSKVPALEWRLLTAAGNLCMDVDANCVRILWKQGIFVAMSKFLDRDDDFLKESVLFAFQALVQKQIDDLNEQLAADRALMSRLYDVFDRASPSSDLCHLSSIILFRLAYWETMPRDADRSLKLIMKLDQALHCDPLPVRVVIPVVRSISIAFARRTEWPSTLAVMFAQITSKLLGSKFVPLRSETLWTLCNFAFSSLLHCEAFLPQVSDLLVSIMEVVNLSNSLEVAELTSTIITNLTLFLSERITNENAYLLLRCAAENLSNRMRTS